MTSIDPKVLFGIAGKTAIVSGAEGEKALAHLLADRSRLNPVRS